MAKSKSMSKPMKGNALKSKTVSKTVKPIANDKSNGAPFKSASKKG